MTKPTDAFNAAQRVTTPEGSGTVIKDCRWGLNEPFHDTIWVLLDSGTNPQRYAPGEIAHA